MDGRCVGWDVGSWEQDVHYYRQNPCVQDRQGTYSALEVSLCPLYRIAKQRVDNQRGTFPPGGV